MLNIFTKRSLSVCFALLWAFLLAACGGGGSGSSTTTTTGTTTTPVAVSPTLVVTGSAPSVTSVAPATVSATLKDGSGNAIAGSVVTFTVTGTGIGVFVPASGTALTNASGIASIALTSGTVTGAGSVSATATVSGATITSNAFGFSATGTTSAAGITLSASTNAISSVNPATLAATVRDATGAALPNTLVTFATTGTGFATFSPAGGTALTDSSGIARITLIAGAVFGADTVKASTSIGGATVTSALVGYTTSGTSTGVARLTLTTSSNTISSSSPATLTATLLDASGAGVANTVVTFATQGIGYGTFFPSGGTALTNSSGIATISLNAGTAVGADTVTATSTVSGVTVASSPLGYTVTAAPVTSTAASISFVSATPTTIAIKGTGGQENSAVVFTVRDSNGNALANQAVTFSLNTTAGGVSLASTNGTSGANGTVSAILQSGTSAVPVRVTATLTTNTAVKAVSSQLVVSTALPHQNGFSIAATKLNIEALTIDGVTTSITARLSDRYGNLVPDGTAVSFRTEGGVTSITPSCVTAAGACTVTLTSSGRRPADGRLTVLATAIGEESFVDLNGNGLYDIGEPYTDLPEAFIDGNEDGVRGINTTEPSRPLEEFVDFNNNGRYDGPDAGFNGVLRACDVVTPTPSGCPAVPFPSTLNVRYSLVIVLSGSRAVIGGLPNPINLPSCSNSFAGPAQQSLAITIGDVNGNSLAGGTTVAITTTNGTIVTPVNLVLPDSAVAAPYSFTLGLKSDAAVTGGVCSNASTSGNLTITVTTPSGIVTTQTVIVND